jgi:hypothetical protein
LEWSKNIGISYDSIFVEISPVRAFETQELILSNPLEFLWDAFLHVSFGGK